MARRIGYWVVTFGLTLIGLMLMPPGGAIRRVMAGVVFALCGLWMFLAREE